MDDADLAIQIADEAARLLLELRETRDPATGADLRAEGDRRSQHLIARLLRENRPSDALLSEESIDDRSRLTATRVWIVDPLDGTRAFTEYGRTDWAVHVALWEAGRGRGGASRPSRPHRLSSRTTPMHAGGGSRLRT